MIRTLLILCFGISFIASCYGSEHKCYYGSLFSSSPKKSSLEVKQCNIPREHTPVSNDNSTTMRHCVVYTNNQKDNDSTKTIDFSCDIHNVCSTGEKQVKVDNGTVHCCSKSLCNLPSLVDEVMPFLQCYKGSVSDQNTSVTNKYCNTTYCTTTTLYESSVRMGIITGRGKLYDCDIEMKCNQFNIKDECKNVTSDSGKLELLCCCSTSNCNKPNYLKSSDEPMGTLPPGFTTDSSHSSMMYIGGVVCATIVAILVIAGLIIVIRKCQQRKDEHVRYIYSQLTADLSEELDDDDAYMIVA